MNEQDKLVATASALIERAEYKTTVLCGNHSIIADEPEDKGGADLGMNPFELLLASLASCTVITLRMYINRKMWIVDEIGINLQLIKRADDVLIDNQITFKGELTEEQRKRLLTIADACPVHKMLVGSVIINNALA